MFRETYQRKHARREDYKCQGEYYYFFLHLIPSVFTYLIGLLVFVQIVKRQKKGKTVSAGYGFVEFDSVETADTACKALQV